MVAVLNLGEVEAVVAADPLHPYDLVSQVETTTSDHDQKNFDVVAAVDVTALEAFAVAVGMVSSYFGSVLDEADSEAALSGVGSNPDLLDEDLAVEPVVALDCF